MDALIDHLLVNADSKVLAIIGLSILWDLRKSVALLTVQMAQVVERVDSHEKRIDKLEQ